MAASEVETGPVLVAGAVDSVWLADVDASGALEVGCGPADDVSTGWLDGCSDVWTELADEGMVGAGVVSEVSTVDFEDSVLAGLDESAAVLVSCGAALVDTAAAVLAEVSTGPVVSLLGGTVVG